MKPLPTLTMLLLPIAAGACAVTEAILQAPQAVERNWSDQLPAAVAAVATRRWSNPNPRSYCRSDSRLCYRAEAGARRERHAARRRRRRRCRQGRRARPHPRRRCEDKARQATSQAAAAEAVAHKAKLDFERATPLRQQEPHKAGPRRCPCAIRRERERTAGRARADERSGDRAADTSVVAPSPATS